MGRQTGIAITVIYTFLDTIKKIVHRMVNTRWTPSGEWMSDTICVYFTNIFGGPFSLWPNLMSVLFKMFWNIDE